MEWWMVNKWSPIENGDDSRRWSLVETNRGSKGDEQRKRKEMNRGEIEPLMPYTIQDHDENEKQFLNAFDIISFSSGVDLSGLLNHPAVPTGSERFISAAPPEKIIGEIEAVAKAEGLTVMRKKDWGLKVEGQNGLFVVVVEIDRLTDELVVVEVKRRESEAGPSCEFWKDKLRPQLLSLTYQPERPVTAN
ncbi:CBL-interacting serine/threonine-protein kinase 14 [Camellia lanceoleosa]|uniref:CBL-interacting serine/threonine-protein kinase 14 n=1 Tax=Camellia lanceoleosa TaxID=1840588 RepID=A0ACC0GFJ8_9ERIC|nr:CBL-interacting serine/threonine-protein kinase 14 [Camellia lanceoleosa]